MVDGGGISGASPAMGRSSQVSVSVLVWLVGRDLTLHPLDTSLDISLPHRGRKMLCSWPGGMLQKDSWCRVIVAGNDGCRESLSQLTGTTTYQARAPRKVARHQTRCQSHAPHCQPFRYCCPPKPHLKFDPVAFSSRNVAG